MSSATSLSVHSAAGLRWFTRSRRRTARYWNCSGAAGKYYGVGGQDGIPDQDRPSLIAGHLSSAYGKYRLWFGSGMQFWYIDIPRHITNPSNIPERDYAHYGESITPWYNAGISGAQKVALNLLVESRNLMEDEARIEIDVGFDYDEENWESLAELDDSELHDPLNFPAANNKKPEQGRAFRAIRFRMRSWLGSSQRLSPDLVSMTLEYYKRLGIFQKYQFNLSVDLSRPHNGLTPAQMAEKLTGMVDDPELVPFTYQAAGLADRVYYVRVFQESRVSHSGGTSENASSLMSLVEL